jgi:hypothetical protein
MARDQTLHTLQKAVWDARLPLEIRLAPSECRVYDQADPYLVCWQSKLMLVCVPVAALADL